jgi:hypothetical protein
VRRNFGFARHTVRIALCQDMRKPERLGAQYRRVLSRLRLLFEVGDAAEDLEDHAEIAVRAEVCDPDAFEFPLRTTLVPRLASIASISSKL